MPAFSRLGHFNRFHRDARLFLVTTLVAGAALSLYWIDFNLYLASLGFEPATIGLVATVASVGGALTAFPASAASDRFGRRTVIAAGMSVSILALVGLLLSEALPLIIGFAAMWAIGQQAFMVVQAPFLAEHSDPEHRNELFALQAAVQTVTNIVAAILGGIVAAGIGGLLGFDPGGPDTYRLILVIMTLLLVAALGTVAMLSDDRPSRRAVESALTAKPRPRKGVRNRSRFVRLLFPGFLIAVGAGQVIPFLNVFVQRKFDLDLTSLNALFAFTSLGTVAAMLAQPRLARRFGQIASVVIVQGASIPFLVVLGFSPVLWTVIGAMAVRNSLMNAGNPIFSAFAMEHVGPSERATLAAGMSVLWQGGWVIGGAWYALLQATLGFEAGYTVNFITVITLYSIATTLYWTWFRDADRHKFQERATPT